MSFGITFYLGLNMTHPHAEILRAIADGVPLSEFEGRIVNKDPDCFDLPFEEVGKVLLLGMFTDTNMIEVRRKQRTHVVNGFTVPAPMDKEPSTGDFYFTPNPYVEDYCTKNTWADFKCEKLWLKRGLCFATKEAAIANAKAMLKINPEAA